MAPSLERGLGYLALDPDDTVLSFVRFLASARTPFLWITSGQPRASVDGGEVLRVTTLRGIGGTDPRRLRDIRAAATTFFDERGPGALVLDCLEPLVLHSGVERAGEGDQLWRAVEARPRSCPAFVHGRGAP